MWRTKFANANDFQWVIKKKKIEKRKKVKRNGTKFSSFSIDNRKSNERYIHWHFRFTVKTNSSLTFTNREQK